VRLWIDFLRHHFAQPAFWSRTAGSETPTQGS